MAKLRIAVITTLGILALQAHAAVWTVELDGSGDFVAIQGAVYAAASGDTIRIGPGRHDTFTYQSGSWSVARVEDKDLTFLGAGAEATILGPANYGDIESYNVYCVLVDGDGTIARFKDLTFENVQAWGIRNLDPGRVETDDCVFRASGGGVYGMFRDGGWIRNCLFVDLYTAQHRVSVLLYEPSVGMLVEGCRFENCFAGVGAFWPGVEDVLITDCAFNGGHVGISFNDGASGAIVNCELVDQTAYSIVGGRPGTIRIEGNTIHQSGTNSYGVTAYQPPGEYILRDNIISGNGVLVGIFTPEITWDCRNNHFLRTGPETWYVRPSINYVYDGPVIHLDFTENYWGTTDPDEVAAWIFDGNDDPEHHYFIDFLPMAGGSVRVEPRTWSDVKSLFRGDEE